MTPIRVRSVTEEDRDWVREVTNESWGSPVISKGQMHDPALLDGLIAELDGRPMGLLTMRDAGEDEIEVVTLDSLVRQTGAGSALLEAAATVGRVRQKRRLWLITTNDNLDALRFYQRRGWRLAAIYPNQIAVSRLLKPSIALVGDYGIPIRDEIELELDLRAPPPRCLRSLPQALAQPAHRLTKAG